MSRKDADKNAKRAKVSAAMLNDCDGDRDTYRAFWDALEEPTREELLTWFREWDGEDDGWNPKPAALEKSPRT